MMGNSPLELHSADLTNFGRSQTISLVSRPKFAKNYESQTENSSVVVAFSHESKKNKIKSLLKFLLLFAFAKSRISLFSRHCEANRRFAKAIQKDKSIK